MMIRSFLRILSLLFLAFLSDYCGVTASSNSTVDLFASNQRGKIKPHQTNFLFIIFDDLRVELSIFKKYGIISPNFERLAARSVTFENAYCQISVCNPSRDSLLTGLRPDTVGTYAFQSTYETYHKHLLLPTRLKRAGYMTAAYGKIRHWEDSSNEIWDKADFANWYVYQAEEVKNMNSSVMPDKIRNETTFPDHYFASMAIEQLQNMTKQDKYFMLAIGFKNPHLAMHVPFEYFEMYRSKVHLWNATDVERTFPRSAPYVSYRCCASPLYMYMNEEGAKYSTKFFRTQDVNDTLSLTIHQELMWGYAAMITMVDKQLGRVLDAIDQLELWGNLTVVLTADHGMHNGEKGIWYALI